MIVATRAAQQPGLLFRKHSARGEDLHWNEGLSKQHDKKHDMNRNDYFIIRIRQKTSFESVLFLEA
jgi:hypothetical protein